VVFCDYFRDSDAPQDEENERDVINKARIKKQIKRRKTYNTARRV
jgi:hypothetical protein